MNSSRGTTSATSTAGTIAAATNKDGFRRFVPIDPITISRADIILPGAAYTEENGLFVNTEGRPQLAIRAGFAPGQAKENWAILRALSGELGAALPWDSLAGLRRALIAGHPHLGAVDQVPLNAWQALPLAPMGAATFRNAIRDFYLTNPIARASTVMAELSAGAKARGTTAMAAE